MTVHSLEPSLRDPITGQSLRLATAEELQSLNQRFLSAGMGDDIGAADGWVVTEDSQSAYPIVDGLIHLLPDNRVSLAVSNEADDDA